MVGLDCEEWMVKHLKHSDLLYEIMDVLTRVAFTLFLLS